jgi:hypothetical protein
MIPAREPLVPTRGSCLAPPWRTEKLITILGRRRRARTRTKPTPRRLGCHAVDQHRSHAAHPDQPQFGFRSDARLQQPDHRGSPPVARAAESPVGPFLPDSRNSTVARLRLGRPHPSATAWGHCANPGWCCVCPVSRFTQRVVPMRRAAPNNSDWGAWPELGSFAKRGRALEGETCPEQLGPPIFETKPVFK